MNPVKPLRRILTFLPLVVLFACKGDSPAPTEPTPDPTPTPAPPTRTEGEIYLDAARIAWQFIERKSEPATGLAWAHNTFQYITVWDMGSLLAAVYAAHELGIISDATFHARVERLLETFNTMGIVQNVGFNRTYDAVTGRHWKTAHRASHPGERRTSVRSESTQHSRPTRHVTAREKWSDAWIRP